MADIGQRSWQKDVPEPMGRSALQLRPGIRLDAKQMPTLDNCGVRPRNYTGQEATPTTTQYYHHTHNATAATHNTPGRRFSLVWWLAEAITSLPAVECGCIGI